MVERADVDGMKNFMLALGGESQTSNAATTPGDNRNSIHSGPVARPAGSSMLSPAAEAMKAILESYRGDNITDPVPQNLLANRPRVTTIDADDAFVAEAMVTERTATGVRIGHWEINRKDSGNRSFFDVVSADSGVAVVKELTLYEAALGLVRILNEGGVLNSVDALDILRTEQDYSTALSDAILFGTRLRDKPTSPKVPVYEARLSDAKSRAIRARDRIASRVRDIG